MVPTIFVQISWTWTVFSIFCPRQSVELPQILFTLPHTHPFNGPFSWTTRVSQYQKGKTNLDFTEARDREWQWHQLGHIQVCISLQTDNHASTPPVKFFLQSGCPSCCPTNSVKALEAILFTLPAWWKSTVLSCMVEWLELGDRTVITVIQIIQSY